jgi:uncharacterized RmlC-like cupin family protein
MKIILNKCYGGFGVLDEVMERLGLTELDEEQLRTNPELIAAIESGEDVGDSFSDLVVVTIPETATDYDVDEYDGLESLIYVVDGKLHWI